MFRNMVRYGLYPVLLFSLVTAAALAERFQWKPGTVYAVATVALLVILMVTERWMPLDVNLGMTSRSFLRDLKYISIDAPVIAGTRMLAGWLGILWAENHAGLLRDLSWPIAAAAFLVAFEFFQYWYHRLSHSGLGPVGSFLWKVHAAHHLPDRLYVTMHAVFHPINAIIATMIIQGTLILLGVSPYAALAAMLLIDLAGLVSHFNVDLRMGFLAYVFIGTETHRMHHSADTISSKNFGNTLALWDIVFGTFQYAPGQRPQRIGVADPETHPRSEDLFRVLAFPFGGPPGLAEKEVHPLDEGASV